MNFRWNEIGQMLVQTGKGFRNDKVPKLAASLAFYTMFSMGPMLLVMIFLANLFWDKEAVEGRLYEQLQQLLGEQAANQVQSVITNASMPEYSSITAVFGIGALLVGATTVFTDIQDSINAIWKLKTKSERGWLKILINRAISFSMVVGLGFLLMVSLLINALIDGLMDKLREMFPHHTITMLYIINTAITLVILWALFAIIFKVLPDALIRWRDVAAGALFTTVLFMTGRFGISFYIGNSDIGSAYGTAGSLVVLLVWVYFSAMILYLGAEFTKAYAVKFGAEIRPDRYAVMVQRTEVESESRTVRENEEEAQRAEREEHKKQI